MAEVWLFILSAGRHWLLDWVVGPCASLAGIVLSWFPKLKIPRRAAWGVASVALLVACFQTWHEEHSRAEGGEGKIQALTRDRDHGVQDLASAALAAEAEKKVWEARLEAKQTEIEGLRDKLAERQMGNLPAEKPKPTEGDGLRWFLDNVPPKGKKNHSAIRVTIQADREMPNANLEVVCDGQISGNVDIEAAGAMGQQVNGPLPVGDKGIRFTVVSPSLSRTQAYVVTLESPRSAPPIGVIRVRRVP